MGIGGFYKGEKKRKRKTGKKIPTSSSPAYVMPEIISKKEKEE